MTGKPSVTRPSGTRPSVSDPSVSNPPVVRPSVRHPSVRPSVTVRPPAIHPSAIRPPSPASVPLGKPVAPLPSGPLPPVETHIGEIAALGAATCWVFTALAFAAAGRRIGATAVNVIRIFAALVILLVLNRLLFNAWMPPIESRSLLLLAISGLIGLSIGDQLLFTAFVDVGPRIALLLMTIVPPVTALIAWPVLDEVLGLRQWIGIAVTLAGIAWAVLERPTHAPGLRPPTRRRARGIAFAIGGGICQSIGLILAKLGMGHGPGAAARVDPWTATMYRMAFAAAGVVVLALAVRRFRTRTAIEVSPESERLPAGVPERSPVPFALAMVAIGVLFGPVLGVWNSMVAVDRAEAGVAATLMAMTPVFILPFAVWIEKERISWRAAAGALVAVSGVAALAGGG